MQKVAAKKEEKKSQKCEGPWYRTVGFSRAARRCDMEEVDMDFGVEEDGEGVFEGRGIFVGDVEEFVEALGVVVRVVVRAVEDAVCFCRHRRDEVCRLRAA